MKTIVSGVQSTGNLHLGNYLGALSNWVRLAHEGNRCIFFLADLHAITARIDSRIFHQGVLDMARLLIACGLDDRTVEDLHLFRQSDVAAHTELQWLLMGTARMGWLNRMTQFKDKAAGQDSVNVGLFAYPVLQAADILLYQADLVPVGDDQLQHLQLTRDIAVAFNKDYGKTFKVPNSLVPTSNARVMSLQDPSRKMSKSDSNASGRIDLLDDAATISKKCRAAVTDSIAALPSEPEGLVGRTAVGNLVDLLAGVSGRSVEEVLGNLGGRGNGALKEALTEATVDLLRPIQQRYQDLADDNISRRLELGAAGPYLQSLETMRVVRNQMGF